MQSKLGVIMGRKIQSIYEYFSEFSEQEIDDMIFDLSMPEKLLIRDRYGDDLHNPVRSTAFTVEKKGRFYSSFFTLGLERVSR